MLSVANLRLRRLCSRLRWGRRRPRPGSVAMRTLGRSKSGEHLENGREPSAASTNGRSDANPTVRIATFNAAMFSMAPAVPGSGNLAGSDAAAADLRSKSANDRRPKGILKQRSYSKSKLRVSINLPDNEISLERGKQQLNSAGEEDGGGGGGGILSRIQRGKAPMASSLSFSSGGDPAIPRGGRSVLEVLREVGADVVALQNVRAEEEKGMSPLSDLAEALGMAYVFAESWAPEYGNAILSRWPIKKWKVQKICDDSDFRNVLKATIDVPRAGEVNIHCTHLDHLDESWRMKQINSILQSSDGPHILAGGLNSLDESDYSSERWNDIVKYYEEIGKPTPKVEVMKFLKGKQFVDAKDFAGECEAIVVVAKGQDVQGTCKYGTRVDYILASPDSPYRFVPGSYTVFSSKGTSDHHIVKVDVKVEEHDARPRRTKPKVVKMDRTSSRGIWSINS
ncbi:hypothetical protein Taro_016839 [Colocasia esculenta]|uniref:Endonuclease/exonuclease/phosphatase domain-containing protein n=1 Tax=Colocasia esculenta TaxID=4460 RepID=A0A843UPT7_COLES|nr:hypothetical protein [Colocasia esculenta]